MKTLFGWLGRGALVASLVVLAACGTTVEAQQERFKRNKDTIAALIAKHPKLRDGVSETLKGFEAEYDKIVKAGGEDAKTELARLNSRVEEFVKKVDPAPASAASAAAPASGKLGGPASMAPGSMAPGSMAPGSMAPGSMAPMAPVSAGLGKLGAPASAGLAAPASMAPATAAPVMGGKLGAAPASMAPASMAPAGLGAPASAAPAPTGLGAPAGKLGAAPGEPMKPGPAAGQTAP